MKLSIQERIILIVFVFVLITGLGIFLFVVPAVNQMNSSTISLEAKQKELKAAEEKQATKAQIEKQIAEAYEQGKDGAQMFFDHITEDEADDYFHQFLNNVGYAEVLDFQIEPMTTTQLGVQFSEDVTVDYPNKQLALEGYENAEEDALIEQEQKLASLLSETETVGITKISFTATIPDGMKNDFLDQINHFVVSEDGNDVRKAMDINEFTYTAPDREAEDYDGTAEITMTINFYSIKAPEVTELETTSEPQTDQTSSEG